MLCSLSPPYQPFSLTLQLHKFTDFTINFSDKQSPSERGKERSKFPVLALTLLFFFGHSRSGRVRISICNQWNADIIIEKCYSRRILQLSINDSRVMDLWTNLRSMCQIKPINFRLCQHDCIWVLLTVSQPAVFRTGQGHHVSSDVNIP